MIILKENKLSMIIKILIILNALLSFTKCVNFTTIDLKEDFFNRCNSEQNFNVSILDEYLTNYIKIDVNVLYIYNNEVAISYYQKDDKLKERKQLSYGFPYITFMWLNKNQIKNNFYFNVECDNKCEYNLHISKRNYAELNIGDIYTYYVTEENKEMIFLIKINYTKYNDSISDISKSKISIWARGSNNNINSKLEPNSFKNIIKDKYQAYLLYKNEINDHEYFLKVEGNIGDLINVGCLIFDGNNTCPKIFKDFGTEVTGFFKKDIFETNCFKLLDADPKSFKQVIYDFDSQNSIDYNYKFIYDNKYRNYYNYDEYYSYTLVCLNFNKNYKYDEYLYSLQYVRSGYEKRYFTSPLIIGKNYKIALKSMQTIYLIPIKPDLDFNFLVYHINNILGLVFCKICEYKNYPFITECTRSEESDLNYLGESNSISYNKTEYKNITPISKTQKVLLIEGRYQNNLIIVNFYTNKNKIFIFPQKLFYNYLRTNNEDNLLINLPYNSKSLPDSPYAYLSLEILSGNASINFETPASSYLETIQNNNKKSFIFRYIQKNENLLKIKAIKNTVYTIFYSLEENHNKRLTGKYVFPIGNNFLYRIKKNSREYFLYFDNSKNNNNYTYFEFHPINCQINVENYKDKNLSKYKDFFYGIEAKKKEYSFKIRSSDYHIGESCLFYASTYIYKKNIIDGPELLFLPNNITQYYFFNYNYEVYYRYFHSDIENDLIIDFKMNHLLYKTGKPSYYLNYVINYNFNYEKKISIYDDSSFKIYSYQIKQFCTDENQFCPITFLVKSNYNKESVVELKAISIENNLTKSESMQKTKSDAKPKSNIWEDNLKKIIVIISGSVLIFIIIISIIVYACIKNREIGDLLALKVNKVSFEEERLNRNKAYEDGLLY